MSNPIHSPLIRPLVLAAALCAAGTASAVPIVYQGSLTPGVTVGGFISDPSLIGSPNDDFWSFEGTAGQAIILTGNRLDPGLDLAFILYAGTGPDTTGLTQLDGADDNFAELPGFDGPFADPQLNGYVLPSTGSYTVQVWDFASTAVAEGTPRCYQLTLGGSPTAQVFNCAASPVPEPGSLPLLGIAALGFAGLMQRRRGTRAR